MVVTVPWVETPVLIIKARAKQPGWFKLPVRENNHSLSFRKHSLSLYAQNMKHCDVLATTGQDHIEFHSWQTRTRI